MKRIPVSAVSASPSHTSVPRPPIDSNCVFDMITTMRMITVIILMTSVMVLVLMVIMIMHVTVKILLVTIC